MLPRVTIVSPCYNHSRYIIDHLESVRRQDYPNIEHIIIDDASTDDSATLIGNWITETGHSCTFIRHERNRGICASLNESIDIATGEFWGHVGTDDILPANRTTVMADFLCDNPDAPMVTADAVIIDSEGRETEVRGERSAFRSYLKFHPAFEEEELGTFRSIFLANYFPTWLLRRSVFEKVGRFDERLRLEDWDMWLRISDIAKIPFIDEPLLYYRWHSSNASGNNPFMQRQQMLTRTLNYPRAKNHVEPELLRKIMLGQFHDSVSNTKNLANLIAWLKSPARHIVFPALVDYIGNLLAHRLRRR